MTTTISDPLSSLPAVRVKRAPLEQKVRLSGSMLWRLQRDFYARHGVKAWSRGLVPHYVTSNSFIAGAYAKVVLGFIRDWTLAGAGSGSAAFDAGHPIYIIELGAGHGRFSHLFLRKLQELLGRSSLAGLRFRYVMTDAAERNVEAWRAHPWLQPWRDAGILDFARYEVGQEERPWLLESGEILDPDLLRNPPIVIANYIFDSVPTDAFYVKDGLLYETLIDVSCEEELDPDDPHLLSRLQLSYAQRPVPNGGYYGDPDLDGILAGYRRRLAESAFLMPVAAVRCLRDLQRLAGGRMLLLSADKGFHTEEALLEGHGEPRLAIHGSGCFSLMVNYHAIGQYCRNQGGRALHPGHGWTNLCLAAFVWGEPAGGLSETGLAFSQAVEEFGPDDFFSLAQALESSHETMSLDQLLACLRLSGCDEQVFLRIAPFLMQQVGSASNAMKRDLRRTADRVWEQHFPLGESPDVAFHLGTLLYTMEHFPEAMEFFDHSIRLHGCEPGNSYNMALCHHALRQSVPALEWLDRTLELAPEFEAARALRIQIQSAIEP
jgi:hypothetical protein